MTLRPKRCSRRGRAELRPISQNADIRYLGKLLGDVIRAYGGTQLFERIEAIRASSVDRARGLGDAAALGRNLEALTLDDTLAFVRGFMLFSMLANLAEDRQVLGNGAGAESGLAVAHDSCAARVAWRYARAAGRPSRSGA